MRLNSLSWFMCCLITLISSCVILCSIDYLSIMDSYLFLIYISLFQSCMLIFVLSNDLLITFFNWDYLGLISYLLINFWSSKLNSGIKAIIYNKIGDLLFLVVLAMTYSIVPFINYCPYLSQSLFLFIFTLPSYHPTILSSYYHPIFLLPSYLLTTILPSYYHPTILPSYHPTILPSYYHPTILSSLLILTCFNKSSMLPWSSWLLNAMVAPSPVSSLLHSSTLVIAGVYLALMLQTVIMQLFDSYSFVVVILFILPLLTLLWSCLKAITLSNIKSIIAFSTISQLSYMFIAIFTTTTLVSLFHIIVHALFKSLLFLLSGSLIHTESNFQSIYRIKINHSFLSIIYLLAGSVLIVSLSKEGIIHSSNCMLSSAFVTMIALLGSIFTMIYTLKIYIYCFYYSILLLPSYLLTTILPSYHPTTILPSYLLTTILSSYYHPTILLPSYHPTILPFLCNALINN